MTLRPAEHESFMRPPINIHLRLRNHLLLLLVTAFMVFLSRFVGGAPFHQPPIQAVNTSKLEAGLQNLRVRWKVPGMAAGVALSN